MVDPDQIYQKIIQLLDESQVEYKEFEHQAAFSYEEFARLQEELGFVGTESKCMVLKAGEEFIVYITTQGQRVNFGAIKDQLKVDKVRLATTEELKELFGAEPGCAYPFGFDEKYQIFIDPRVYEQDRLLFSPLFPTKTIQATAVDLKNIFDSLPNQVTAVTTFNQ